MSRCDELLILSVILSVGEESFLLCTERRDSRIES